MYLNRVWNCHQDISMIKLYIVKAKFIFIDFKIYINEDNLTTRCSSNMCSKPNPRWLGNYEKYVIACKLKDHLFDNFVIFVIRSLMRTAQFGWKSKHLFCKRNVHMDNSAFLTVFWCEFCPVFLQIYFAGCPSCIVSLNYLSADIVYANGEQRTDKLRFTTCSNELFDDFIKVFFIKLFITLRKAKALCFIYKETNLFFPQTKH